MDSIFEGRRLQTKLRRPETAARLEQSWNLGVCGSREKSMSLRASRVREKKQLTGFCQLRARL